MKKLFAGIFATVLGLGCLTACDKDKVSYDAAGAAEFLDLKYTEELQDGRVDYEVISTVAYKGVTYEIEWSVDAPETAVKVVKGETTTKIDVNEAMAEDLDYTLTATVKAKNGTTATVSFPLTLLKAKALIPVEITEKPVAGTAYKLYVYQDDAKKDCYFNGKIQSSFYLGSVEDYEEAVNVYVEYVEGSDSLFNLYFNEEVAGEMTKQYFGIRENWNATKGYWSYNPYIESTPVSQFEYSTEYKTIVTTVAACSVDEETATQDTTKVIYWGNSGDKYTTIGGVEIEEFGKEDSGFVANLVTLQSAAGVSEADKVAFEKDSLQLAEYYRGNSTVELSTLGKRYPDVKIAWSTDSALLTIADDELKIGEVTEATTAKITATFTVGETTDTKEFNVELKPSIALPENPTDEQIVNAAYGLLDGEAFEETYSLTGVITKVNSAWNEQYGNITVTIVVNGMTDKPIECYRLKSDEGETDASILKAGDTITVSGTLKNYGGKIEFDSGCRLKAYTAGEEIVVEYTKVSIPEALEAADGTMVEVAGTVAEINTAWNEGFGNISVTIVDEKGNELYLYRLATKVELGDIITVKGEMATYNDNRQVAAGAKAEITGHDNSYNYTEMDIVDALEAADGTNVIVTGTVASIGTPYSEQHGNISVTIKDEKDNSLYLYRLTGNVAVGNVIKVKGTMATYNGNRQLTGGTYELISEGESGGEIITPPGDGEEGGDIILPGGDDKLPEGALTVNVSIADYAAANDWEDATRYSEILLNDYLLATANGTAVGNYSLNTGKFYGGNNWRLYQSESATLTISATEGVTIYSVKLTYNVKNTGILVNADGLQIASDFLYKDINAESVILTVGNSEKATNGQVQILSIEVVYLGVTEEEKPDEPIKPEEPEEPVEPEVPEYTAMSIADANAAADGTKVEVSGTVSVASAWSDSYGNMNATIVDAEGNELYVYRLATQVALGDIITVKGEMATYENNRQIAAGATATITGHDDSYDYAEMTITEALAAADNTNVIVTGTVAKIGTAYNEQYGNISVYISDDDGTQLYVYRLTGNVTVGQIIKVKGSMATYSGARQIAAGATFEAVGTHTCAKYTEATCTTPASCVVCGTAKDDVLSTEHSYVNGVCSLCGAADPNYEGAVATTLATFTFGENGDAAHKDGSSATATYTETQNGYTLSITDASKMYPSAYDAMGNSCLKLGTGSAAASFTFTVPENVSTVYIYIAGYKTNGAKIKVNGGEDQTISTLSNNGEYTKVMVDTSSVKTVTLATLSGGYRAMLNTIEFVGLAS